MTINNPHKQFTEEDLHPLQYKYFVSGLEYGEECGTPHLQCFMILKSPQRMTALKKIFGNNVHLEAARGNNEKASSYCMKEDPHYVEFGSLIGTGQGARNDILALRDALRADTPDMDIVLDDALVIPWFKFRRAVEDLRKIFTTPPTRESTRVALIFGPPGTGKSHFARECFPDAYWKDNSKWWPGYNGQETVIWDEFGGWSCTPAQYNAIFDKYPTWVEPKGGAVPLRATNFIIISNFTPATWWNAEKTTVCLGAVTRRIGRIYWFKKLGEDAEIFENYELFDKAIRGEIWRPNVV